MTQDAASPDAEDPAGDREELFHLARCQELLARDWVEQIAAMELTPAKQTAELLTLVAARQTELQQRLQGGAPAADVGTDAEAQDAPPIDIGAR